MDRNIKSIALITALVLASSGCANDIDKNSLGIGDAPLTPAYSYYNGVDGGYTDEGIIEEATATYVSDDGLCTINVMPDYLDITLDYESGDRRDVGAAYGKMLLEAVPDFESVMEPYIHENLRNMYNGTYDPQVVEDRIYTLYDSMRDEYKVEIDGLATELSEGRHGIAEDGQFSYEEILALQMVPDALRPTACSALSLWGDRTATGDRITLRNLEWYLGSNDQMGSANAVIHMKNGERSITAIGIAGMLDIISAINDDGVFAAILDVGSINEAPFIYEGKKCYTMELRYALEEYTTARELGEFMVGESGDFTWCHNIIISDENDSFCAEDCVSQVAEAGEGFSILRDADTPIMEGLTWDSTDSLCIVNSFTTQGNQDAFTGVPGNYIRFAKYNEWVNAIDVFTVKDVKDLITQESVDQYDVVNVHSNSTSQLIIIDYATGSIQVAFTGEGGVQDNPVFIDVGHY